MASSTNACTKITCPRRLRFAALMMAGALLGLSGSAQAGDNETGAIVTNQQLLQKLDAMERRIRFLEAELKRKDASNSASKTSSKPEAQPAIKPSNTRYASTAASDVVTPTRSSSALPVDQNQPNKPATPSPTPITPGDEGILGLTASPV
jgi:hypothetical protein